MTDRELLKQFGIEPFDTPAQTESYHREPVQRMEVTNAATGESLGVWVPFSEWMDMDRMLRHEEARRRVIQDQWAGTEQRLGHAMWAAALGWMVVLFAVGAWMQS